MVQAVKTKQLNADDLPVVGHEERAQTLYDHFASSPATKVLRKFLQIYSSRLLFVFVLQVFNCACRFLPQVLLFNFLRLFEQRDAGASNQLQLWLMAATLGGSMVLSSRLTSLVDGISDLKLSLPIHQQLFAVVTSKILRLKDTVVVGSNTNDKTMDPEGGEGDKDNDNDDDGGGPPRTRNSILNLLGVDADKISNFADSSHTMLDCT